VRKTNMLRPVQDSTCRGGQTRRMLVQERWNSSKIYLGCRISSVGGRVGKKREREKGRKGKEH